MTDFNLNDCHASADVDENHEKARDRKERLVQSKKARGKRQLIRDKKTRKYETGFGGNV